MGNNCSCLRVKQKETEISINEENKIYYCLNSLQLANPKLLPSIILIQSHVRGLITRIQINNNPFFAGSFLPIMDPDLHYIFPSTSRISDEEIQYVFNSFDKVNDNIPIICLQTIEYSNGCQYYGEWNKVSNQKHGRGILKWQDGLTYYGQFKMNKANGKGKLVIKQGEEYDGDWVDNKANGLGVYKSNIAKYEGKWKDDKQDGIGTETWSNGICYTGEFKNGQKTGNGKCRYIDGSTYTGEFLNNKFHGRGLYIWADKREYKGDWKFDKMEGEGVFKWPDGRKYIGHYKDDKKDGYGIFEWPGGKKYKGYWKKGKPYGEGEFYNPKEKAWQKGKWGNTKKERESIESFSIGNHSTDNLMYNSNDTHNSKHSGVSNQKVEIKV